MAINIMVEEDDLLNALMRRVGFWTDDEDICELFYEYYSNLVYSGCFDGAEVNIMSIVDNDYVNWTSVFSDEDLENEDWITEDRILARYNGWNLVDAS